MNDKEVLAELNHWFKYLDEQRERASEMQRIAKLARTDPVEARKQQMQLNRRPIVVYDGANLQKALLYVKEIIEHKIKEVELPTLDKYNKNG